MARRKQKYTPKSFESTGDTSDTSANMYISMMKSPAFMDLTTNQRLLYVYMKACYYGQKRKPVEGDRTAFTFNQCTWIKGNEYGFCIYSNRNQFYRDRNALVSHGFIDVVESNRNQRESNVYRYSDRWQTWRKIPP